MQILLVSHRFPRHSVGGTEVLANDLARSLVARGHEVVWLGTGEQGEYGLSYFRSRSDGILEWEISPGFSNNYPVTWRLDEKRQREKVQLGLDKFQKSFDVVHFLHFARTGLQFLDLPFFKSSKIVFTLTDYTCICPDFQLFKRHERTICRTGANPFECLCCLGIEVGEQQIMEWRARNLKLINERADFICVQTPEQKRVLVESGIKENLFFSCHARYKIPSEWRIIKREDEHIFRFCFLGRFSREKGLDIAVKAFHLLRKSEACFFWIFGNEDDDLSYSSDLQTLIHRSEGITIHGALPLESLGEVIQSIDCILVPSLWLENHPLVISYARYFGIPIICSNVASMSHLTENCGVHFAELGNPIAWTEAMNGIMRSQYQPKALDHIIETEFEDFVTDLANEYGN